MNYVRALAERRHAWAGCRAARRKMDAAGDDMIAIYQARPLPALAGAAGLGFLLAQLRVGGGLIRAGVRIASGPAWGLVRQYLSDRS